MPIYKLNGKLQFPHPSEAEPNGLLAIGGDLSIERLILAYSMGIFPWSDESMPLLWWSPDPRMMMYPSEVYVSKSMRKLMRESAFEIRYDTAFRAVIEACANANNRAEKGTWLTAPVIEAFLKLHRLGLAHSVEAWKNGELVGGLYGLSLGSCFFGESMFYKVSNASKAAFIGLAEFLIEHHFTLIDAQQESNHLASLGARPRPRVEFLNLLSEALQKPTLAGKWNSDRQYLINFSFE